MAGGDTARGAVGNVEPVAVEAGAFPDFLRVARDDLRVDCGHERICPNDLLPLILTTRQHHVQPLGHVVRRGADSTGGGLGVGVPNRPYLVLSVFENVAHCSIFSGLVIGEPRRRRRHTERTVDRVLRQRFPIGARRSGNGLRAGCDAEVRVLVCDSERIER